MLDFASDACVHDPIIFGHVEAGSKGGDASANILKDAGGKVYGEGGEEGQ